jgi:NADP-dependent 3-hydroxy acid dehydrogenase YdfG
LNTKYKLSVCRFIDRGGCVVETLLQIRGKQDAIVHNAGSLVNKPFADLTQADLESVYKVNVFELRT